MERLWQDVRYGCRMLTKDPGFTLTAVVVLAVGIGANTAIFSVINAVLLRPLPYGSPDRIVELYRQKKGGSETNSYAKSFLYLRENNQVFEEMASWGYQRMYLTGCDHPQHVETIAASARICSLLKAEPMLGRSFLPEEDQPGRDRVVVLSHAFWRDQWGADPKAIGKLLYLDSEAYTIVGVMPVGFEFPFGHPTPFWVPQVLRTSKELGYEMPVNLIARLKEGVTIEQARAQMALLAQQLEEVDPRLNAGFTVTLHRYLDSVFTDSRRILLLLLGAAGFVLLIACSNVANLLLARATLRQREIGIRVALGSSRGRIIRQMLVENTLWSLPAGLLGLLVAYWAVRGLISLCPSDIPRIGQTRIDATVLGFTLGLSILTGLLFGLAPAWKATDVRTGQALKERQARSPTRRGWRHLRDGLVIAQIGIALMLLMGAALLIQTLAALYRADLGFRPKNVLILRVELPQVKYPRGDQRTAFFNQLLQAIRTVPEVRSAALVSVRWGIPSGGTDLISIGPFRPSDPEELSQVHSEKVGRDFFETMGIPVLTGRTFTEDDVQASAISTNEPLLIDETLARRHFPNTNPVGQRIHFRENASGIVVGVVGTARSFDELTPTRGTLYHLLFRSYYYAMEIVLRTEGDPLRVVSALRAQVQTLDRGQACEFRTVESSLTKMLGPRRFSMMLLGLFAGIALIIASAGIYGLLQYVVAQQTHEIGIRIALGARQADVLKAILRHGLRLTLVGVVIGLAGAWALTRFLSSLLYSIPPTDLLTFACTPLVLITVALLGSYLPARRAARVDPMVALRHE